MKYRIDQEPPTQLAVERAGTYRLLRQSLLIILTLALSFAAVAVPDIKYKLHLLLALTLSMVSMLCHSWYMAANPAPYPISASQCEDVIRWRGKSVAIDQYVNKVVHQKRELVLPEYEMLRAQYDEVAGVDVKERLYRAYQ